MSDAQFDTFIQKLSQKVSSLEDALREAQHSRDNEDIAAAQKLANVVKAQWQHMDQYAATNRINLLDQPSFWDLKGEIDSLADQAEQIHAREGWFRRLVAKPLGWVLRDLGRIVGSEILRSIGEILMGASPRAVPPRTY